MTKILWKYQNNYNMTNSAEQTQNTLRRLSQRINDLEMEIELKAKKYREQLIKIRKAKFPTECVCAVNYNFFNQNQTKFSVDLSASKKSNKSAYEMSSEKKNGLSNPEEIEKKIQYHERTISCEITDFISKRVDEINNLSICGFSEQSDDTQILMKHLQDNLNVISHRMELCRDSINFILQSDRNGKPILIKEFKITDILEELEKSIKKESIEKCQLRIMYEHLITEKQELLNKLQVLESSQDFKQKAELDISIYNESIKEDDKSDIKSCKSEQIKGSIQLLPRSSYFYEQPNNCTKCQSRPVYGGQPDPNNDKFAEMESLNSQLRMQIDNQKKENENLKNKLSQMEKSNLAVMPFQRQLNNITEINLDIPQNQYLKRLFLRRKVHRSSVTTITKTITKNIPISSIQDQVTQKLEHLQKKSERQAVMNLKKMIQTIDSSEFRIEQNYLNGQMQAFKIERH